MPPRLSLNQGQYVCTKCQKIAARVEKRRSMSAGSAQPDIYDVVTVGGGPVGLALLTALKSSPVTSHLRTALIEIQDLSKQRRWSLPSDEYSNRASSLTPSSVSFLEGIGAWQHVEKSRLRPYHEMQVWDAANDASIQFDWKAEAQRYNAPPRVVATMTENANLTKGLLARLLELDSESSLLSNTSVSSIAMGIDEPEGLNLSSWPFLNLRSSGGSPDASAPSKIAARLLVGADGFNSPVRSFANISSGGWDYNRHGVVATLTVDPREPAYQGQQNLDSMFSENEDDQIQPATAFQRFLPQLGGPIAVLPLPNNRASLVWSTTPSNAAYLKSLPSSAFVTVLNAALRLSQTDIKYLFTLNPQSSDHEPELTWRLQHTPHPNIPTLPSNITSVQEGSVASFPLRFRHASSLTSPRVALVGDAAHTIHPLAGQGLNLGLGDARALANTIAYAVEHGMDIGDSMALEQYSSERFGKGILMGGGVDLLNSMYQLGAGGEGLVASLLGKARGLGMKAVGSQVAETLGVKGWVMRHAEG